jgi:hypothetical protein
MKPHITYMQEGPWTLVRVFPYGRGSRIYYSFVDITLRRALWAATIPSFAQPIEWGQS